MKWRITLFLVFGFSLGAQAQVNPAVRFASRQFPVNVDSLLHSLNQQMREQKNIIVEFRDEPMFIARRRSPVLNKTISADQYLSRFSQFAAGRVCHRTHRKGVSA